MRCISREDAHYVNFPFPGAAFDQPTRTMEVFDMLQSIAAKKIKKENQASPPRIGVRRGR